MKKILTLCALAFSLITGAQTTGKTFYIDFGQNNVTNQGFTTDGADKFGHYWNNLHGKGTGAPDKAYPQTLKLVDSSNATSDYELVLSSRFSTNGYTNGGLQSPKESLLGDLAVESATQDYIFLESNQDYGILRFRGLDKQKGYRFYSFGSRQDSGTPGREATFIFRGENTWQGDHKMGGAGIGDGGYNGNNNNIQESDIIFPDENGCIEMTIVKKTKSGMVHLNAMKMVEVTGVEHHDTLTLKQKVLIDFGETSNATRGHQTSGADANGNYWSNVSSGSSSSNVIIAGKTVSLKNTTNSAASITLKCDSKFLTNGLNNGGYNSPDSDNLGELAIATATEDYAFTEDDDVHYITLSRLKTASCYRFTIFGSRATSSSDIRSAIYSIKGQSDWQTTLFTSGADVGGEGVHGNVRNVAVSDLIFPDKTGKIQIGVQRNQAIKSSFAHFNIIKIEEFEGAERPEDPIVLTSLTLKGNAEEMAFKLMNSSTHKYQTIARLTAGTFTLEGKDASQTYTLGATDTEGAYSYDSTTPFTVSKDEVVRIIVDTQDKTVEVTPVTMNVRGNIGGGNPEIPYKGNGVFEGEVTLPETSSQQWVDKTMYFALNNSDEYAIARLQGGSTRYELGMASDGQATENIYQNAGTYTITVDMANMTYNIQAPIDENRISVFGSSVANGQGATDYKGYRYLYGQQLIARHEAGLSDNAFYTSNVSIGGNTTTNLLGRYDDLIRDFGRYVIFGLSLGNEGIHGASDQQAVMNQWKNNMLTLISKVKADGKIPMVMNNYTRADYTESDYYYVKQLNLIIHQWAVPSTNVLGSIDDGTGKWAEGYISDTYHQNTAGHREFMFAMVPSLFDAIKAGKGQPTRNQKKSMTLEAGKQLSFNPEGTLHPFTLTLHVKGTEGTLATLMQSAGQEYSTLVVNADGTVTFTSPTGATITSTSTINDDAWHNVTLTSYFAQKRTLLYIDKVSNGELAERLGTIQNISIGDKTNSREMSELTFWRSGMTPEEISAVCDGKMLKSSLELYVPLGGSDDMENLAQSTNSLKLSSIKELTYEKKAGTVTVSSDEGTAGFGTGEAFNKLVDGDKTTKWCLNITEGDSIYNIFHTSEPIYIKGYKITTGGDNATYTGRNPKSWVLYGSTSSGNPGENDPSWEAISTIASDTKLQDQNKVTYTYTFKETAKAYQHFKWVITARKGGGSGVIQVAEFEPYYTNVRSFVPAQDDEDAIKSVKSTSRKGKHLQAYNLNGQPIEYGQRGIVVTEGKKTLIQ